MITPRLSAADGAGTDGAPVRKRIIFLIVTGALFIQSVDVTIVATALHTLQHDLGTSVSWAGWTITIYAVAMVVMLPVSVRLAERFGQKRLFLVSVAVFGAASLCCGLANNIFLLIALRGIQAVGGAGLTPSATSIVVTHFGKDRDKAVGLFGSTFTTGGMVGPILGGLFVAYLSWRWIFFVNVPICVVLVLLGARFIPPDPERAANARVPFDVSGMALLGSGLVVGMIGITLLGEPRAQFRLLAVAGLALAFVLLWGFMRHVHRVRYPFVAPLLIHGRGFGAVNAINILYGGAKVGVISLVPLYAINRYHLGALNAGTLLTAQAIAGAVLSILAALSLRRTGYRAPLYAGAVTMAIGMFGLAVSPPDVPVYAWLAGAAFLVGVGSGWCNPAARNAGLQLVPDQSAAITALRAMGWQIGTVASVSVITAIISASSSPSIAQAYTFAAFGAILLVTVPIVARVPEHRGAW